jgi:hypothetical protein
VLLIQATGLGHQTIIQCRGAPAEKEGSMEILKIVVRRDNAHYRKLLACYENRVSELFKSGRVEINYRDVTNQEDEFQWPELSDFIQDIASLNDLHYEYDRETWPPTLVFSKEKTVPIPCIRCKAPSAFVCTGCHSESYCSLKCQKKIWLSSHRSECHSPIAYEATGYLMGLSHFAQIVNGEFQSKGQSHVNVLLSQESKRDLCAIIAKEKTRFHDPGPEDKPRMADIGNSSFILNGQYADPRDVPGLVKLFLSLDPGLAKAPGGLRIK